MKIRSKFLAAIALTALLITGCGDKSASIDPAALADSLAKNITYEEQLTAVDQGDISDYFSDLKDGVECLMYMGSGKTAEEIAIFTAPDEKTAEETKASVQTFLDDQIVLTQIGLQQLRPALLFRKSYTAVSAVSGVGAVAVGIGIAEAKDVFFHRQTPPFNLKNIMFFSAVKSPKTVSSLCCI